MARKPTVTLALPAYNEEKRLEKTVATILNQSYTDFELLLGDNCSTDGTMQIMQKLAASDSRIRILPSPRNMGAVYNFARLLNEAQGEFFAWVGAHDYYNPNWLSELLAVISENESIALVFPQCQRILPDYSALPAGLINLDSRGMPPAERIKLLCSSPAAGERIYGLYRTEIAKKCPIKIIIRWDTLFLARLAFYGDMVSINKCLWYRYFDAPPKTGKELKTSALLRQYRIVYPEGTKPSLPHRIPQFYHLFLILKDGIKRCPKEGLHQLLLTWVGLKAYYHRGKKNLPCELQYFKEYIKNNLIRKGTS